MDVADAHWRALQYLQNGGETAMFHLGNGGGYSVKQVFYTAHLLTGLAVPVQYDVRRAGDPAVANASRVVLRWQPTYAALETIVRQAWAWQQNVG